MASLKELRTEALLVGVAEYTSEASLPDIPQVLQNLTELKRVLTDPDGIALPASCVQIISNPRTVREFTLPLRAAARSPLDVLLLYYCGHSILDSNLALHLGVSESTSTEIEESAVPFALLRRILVQSAAKARILILDTCFAGRSIESGLSQETTFLTGQVDVAGAYTLASSAKDLPSLVRPGESMTGFTKALIDSLQGPEIKDEHLTLGDVERRLRRLLLQRDLPELRVRSDDSAARIILRTRPREESATDYAESPSTPIPSNPLESDSAELSVAARDAVQFPLISSAHLVVVGSHKWPRSMRSIDYSSTHDSSFPLPVPSLQVSPKHISITDGSQAWLKERKSQRWDALETPEYPVELRFSRNTKYCLAFRRPGERHLRRQGGWVRVWDLETMRIWPENLPGGLFRHQMLPEDSSAVINELIFSSQKHEIGNIITGSWIKNPGYRGGVLSEVYIDPITAGFISTWQKQDEWLCRLDRALAVTGTQPKLPHYSWLSSISSVSWGSAIIGLDREQQVPAWCSWDEITPRLIRVTDLGDLPHPYTAREVSYSARGVSHSAREVSIFPTNKPSLLLLVFPLHLQLRDSVTGALVHEMKLPRTALALFRRAYWEIMHHDAFGNSWMNYSGQAISCISIQ